MVCVRFGGVFAGAIATGLSNWLELSSFSTQRKTPPKGYRILLRSFCLPLYGWVLLAWLSNFARQDFGRKKHWSRSVH
jgi:hypothetical protein